MFQDSSNIQPIRSITCLIHKRQKATHLCTQLQCNSNAILCQICMSQSKYRNCHTTHENSIKPINQGIQLIAYQIKNQIKSTDIIYDRSIGNRDNQMIKNNLQKVDYLNEQMQNRLESIKKQVDLEIQLLNKQFQRQLILEKQQFIRKIDQYKKIFNNNLELLKRQSYDIIAFQQSLKFYSNPNTLLLKLSMQTQKRSLDWLIQQKKILSKIIKMIQSTPSYSYSNNNNNNNQLENYINKVNEMNMMIKPVWIGQKRQLQNQKQLRKLIRNNLNSWISIPQIKDLSKSLSQNSGSHHSSSQDYRTTSTPYSPYGAHYSNNII